MRVLAVLSVCVGSSLAIACAGGGEGGGQGGGG
jgi:hypothetical protein